MRSILKFEARFAALWFLALFCPLCTFAQTAPKLTWESVRAEALEAYLKGDKSTAMARASQAVTLAMEQFGRRDWRTAADLLRAAFYADQTGDRASASADMRRAGEVIGDLGVASIAATRDLADDYFHFANFVEPSGPRRNLLLPGGGHGSESPDRDVRPTPNEAVGRIVGRPIIGGRVALVIGNNAYQGDHVPKLCNAINDASLVKGGLEKVGFHVIFGTDLTRAGMMAAVDEFIASIGPGTVALLYYSGHGVQIQNENFLIPVEFQIPTGEHAEDEVPPQAYSLLKIYERLVNSPAALNILVLDACRTYDFDAVPRKWFERLGTMPVQKNSLIAFSTGDGEPASDGPHAPKGCIQDPNIYPHGPYASRFVELMATKGLEIREIFKRVKLDFPDESTGTSGQVNGASARPHHQRPWFEEDLVQDFYFIPPLVKWNSKDALEYLYIPKGTFMMGCVPADDRCSPAEKPAHKVTFTEGFWIGHTEVTVGAYKDFAKKTNRAMPPAIPSVNEIWRDNNHPIVKVTWENANAFCQYAGGRLATEAEWEYAARGGKSGSILGETSESTWIYTRPVSESASNEFGLLGAAENAEEWVADWYDATYYITSPEFDPSGPSVGTDKVVRGGSWVGPRRLSERVASNPDVATSSRGFRCVVPADLLER